MSQRAAKILKLAVEERDISEAGSYSENNSGNNNVDNTNAENSEFSDYDSDDSVKDKTYEYFSDSEIENDLFQTTDQNIDTDETDTDSEINRITPSITASDNSDWSEITSTYVPFDLFPEKCILDPKISSTTIQKPIDVFMLFLNDELLDLIATQTNIYARQQLNADRRGKSRIKSWSDTEKTEICKFLGVTLAMGLTTVPAVNFYWSKDPLYHNEFISSTITRDRYLLLLSCIHFANNENADQTNRLYKIDPLISTLLKNYQKILYPGRVLVIDESMVPFRGRLLFRQYIPNKTHKYGVKLYKLCSSNGYTFNVQVYTGKGSANTINSDLGHSSSIVLSLLEFITEKEGRILFADNYYSSIPLCQKLYSEKILYCGTLRSNRKGIPKIFGGKLKKSEVQGRQKDNVKIIKWVDKRPVMMISTHPKHTDHLVSTGKRNRKGDDIMKPQPVIDYNIAKKGVDYSDQMSSYHSVIRKSFKWYRKVALELLLGTTVVNAWIVFNMVAEKKLSITEFRRQLSKELTLVEREPINNQSAPKKKAHTFIKPEGPGRKKRKPRKGCYSKLRQTLPSREADKKVRRVISFCNECIGNPGYCLPCFNTDHH